jgi:nitronate monooxygenase
VEPVLRTWLTDRFGLQIPLVAAPMGGAASASFAAAVSRSGGLGMVAAGSKATAESVRVQLDEAATTGLPFGVGVLGWVVARRPEIIEAVVAAEPVLVSISYGGLADHFEALRAAGIPIATQVGTVGDARQAAAQGVDVVVARGGEGGGHGRDEMATLPLLQEVLDAVDVPVLAAGGIATARGLAAVLAAGAVGAWVGTAFLGCVETAWSDAARKSVLGAGDGDTIYTRTFDIGLGLDWPPEFGGRALRNTFSDTWHGREAALTGDHEASEQMARAVSDQNMDVAPVWAGQSVSLVNKPRTVAEVIAGFAEAETLLRRWG